MMKKYLANSNRNEIKEVEVLKESESSVYIPDHWYPAGQRYDKITATRGYFDTFQEARMFLVHIEEDKIAALTRELARRQKAIDHIMEMTEELA